MRCRSREIQALPSSVGEGFRVGHKPQELPICAFPDLCQEFTSHLRFCAFLFILDREEPPPLNLQRFDKKKNKNIQSHGFTKPKK